MCGKNVQHEYEDKEVEGIKGPAQKTGCDCMPTIAL
jgi:hypothetical protein